VCLCTVGEVDAELFETVVLETLEAKHIQNAWEMALNTFVRINVTSTITITITIQAFKSNTGNLNYRSTAALRRVPLAGTTHY
jgi:hypothetical protein